jgi:hypothetical protein
MDLNSFSQGPISARSTPNLEMYEDWSSRMNLFVHALWDWAIISEELGTCHWIPSIPSSKLLVTEQVWGQGCQAEEKPR